MCCIRRGFLGGLLYLIVAICAYLSALFWSEAVFGWNLEYTCSRITHFLLMTDIKIPMIAGGIALF